MGSFFVASRSLSEETCRRLDQRHREHGFQPAKQLDLGNVSLHLYRRLSGGGGLFIETAEDAFACLTGELLYRGTTGEAALRLYLDDLARGRVDHSRLIGQFALIVKDASGLRIGTDPMAFYQVYLAPEAGIVSSSFWSMLELLPTTRVDPAGIYQYAWNGATFGGTTFVREIRRLPAGSEIAVGDRLSVQAVAAPPALPAPAAAAPIDAHVDAHAERLRSLFSDLAGAYGERLHVSFSSGYDSRLVLAGLKAAGLRPALFVYGQPGDIDVEIARQVATGEGLALNVVDKRQMADPAAARSTQRQEADFVRFDAWKVDGIFDDGVDTPDRLSRHADGGIPLNGSLGEIYRNFFYIPDRPLTLKQVADSFFSGYAPAACTERFKPEEYNGELARAFQTELGTGKTRISRAEVEALYPLVRGRYWTGRDVTLNLRFGAMHFPFMNHLLIDGTPEIPLAYKTHGRLEAKLIERLDPALAAYPSGYGYRFSDPPPLKHRAKSWLTLFRPPWLRRYSYRLRFSRPRPQPACVTADRLSALIDPAMPYMRRYFHPDRLYDPDALNRVATMEYIFQRYGSTETQD